MNREIEDILEDLLQISNNDPLFQKLDVLDITRSVIKARLMIRGDIYVQIYENVRRPKCSYTLIFGNNRFYGRDMREGAWHRHCVDVPEIHDDSEDASKPIGISDFVEEVKNILIQKNLL